MARMVARRLLWSLPLLLVVSALTFVLAWLTPGDAARVVLGTNTSPEAYAQVRAQLGLDQPLPAQYWDWLSGALRGDLGQSLFSGQPVTEILAARLGVSLSLIVLTTLTCAVLGIGLGLLSAVRGGALARFVDGVSVVAMSVPTFWLGLLLILLLAVQFPLLPATGYVPFADDPVAWSRSLVLPVTALALGGTAVIAKQTRGAVIDAFAGEYVRALRANGLPTRSILLKHVLKNAAVPVTTVLGLLVITLLGGTILVEQVFALPGIGGLAVSATATHDLPVLQGVVVVYALVVVAMNLLTDVAYAWLNPKVDIA